jgi:peptidoglycan pentaglycine glycine transferase (the first glycine)
METATFPLHRILIEDSIRWNSLVAELPQAHILQTWQWGQVKKRLGWKVFPYVWLTADDRIKAAALVMERSFLPAVFGKLNLLYIPRGPLLDWNDPALREFILDDLQTLARKMGSIFLKIDPEVRLGTGIPGAPDAVEDPNGSAITASLMRRQWLFPEEQIQFRNTVLLDLTPSEEELMSRMKPKTRYNIRLAGKKGVEIREGSSSDLPALFRMYAETSIRDGFVIRDQAYYEFTWGTLLQNQMAMIWIAEVDGQMAAAIVVFHFAGKAWYLNGMSGNLYRERMPNYLLQWEAMSRLRRMGIHTYDLWGAPDLFNETDPMWGVFRFKEGLGGSVLRTPGAWDYPSRPWLYRFYTRSLPRVMAVMRRRGKSQTQEAVA